MAKGRDVEIHQLDGRLQVEGISLFMHLMEALQQLRHGRRVDAALRQRHLDRVLLAEVTHVGVAFAADVRLGHVLGSQFALHAGAHFCEHSVQRFCSGLGHARDARADDIAAQVAHQHAPGGENAGPVGDDDLARLQFAHQGGPVQRAAAAERQQDEVARVITAAHGDQFERVDHIGVSDADDAQRRLGD